MALRGIEEYIALDANNNARVKDSGNIVNIEGNIFLYPLKKEPSNIIIIHIGLCVSSYFGEAKRNRDRLPAVYKQCVRSAHMGTVIIIGHYSGRAIIISLPWNTLFYFDHQKPYMNNNDGDCPM